MATLYGYVSNTGAPEYDDILNSDLPKEEKVKQIKMRGQEYRDEVDRQHLKDMAKLIGGAALEIGSAAIPMGAGARLAGGLAKGLMPYVGKKIAQEVGTGLVGGGLSGGVFGFGRGLMEDKNPLLTAGQDALLGTAMGGAVGYGAGQIGKKIAFNNLLKNDTDELASFLKPKPNNAKFANYYNNYVDGLKDTAEFSRLSNAVRATGSDYVIPGSTGERLFDQYMYHGTPYNDTYTDFDLNYIKSGEGANMYGSGIYGAKDVEIANKNYRYMGNEQDPIMYRGKPLLDLYDDLERQASRLNPKAAQEYYDKMSLIENLEYNGMLNELDDYYSPNIQKWYRNEIEPNITMPGNLYKVRIPDNEYFLDFTKSFDEQSPYVKENLKKYFNLEPGNEDIDTGETLYHYITREFANNDQTKASELLNNAGIQGNRYIGDRDGEAFVIYNPKNAEIVDAYMGNNKTTQLIRENAYNKYSDVIIKEGNSKNLTDIKVPDEEYARVSKAINSKEYPKEYQNETNFPLTLSNGRIYLIENNGNSNFRIITKKAVNNESTFFDK